MIINLRGTNGSGKSTVARDLIERQMKLDRVPGEHPISGRYLTVLLDATKVNTGGPRHVVGYHLPEFDLCVVGRYETDCGGCDGIKTQDLIYAAVTAAAKRYRNVLFEGVIVSTIFERYLTLSRALVRSKAGPFVWAYLDTPGELCLRRIQARNGGKPIKEELVLNKLASIARTREKAGAEGDQWVTTIRHKKALEDVIKLIREA